MRLCHAAFSSLDLLRLSIKQQLCLPIKTLSLFSLCTLHYLRAYVVAGVMWLYSGANMNDMQLRAGFVGQIGSGLSGQNRLFGAVGGQQDPGREDANRTLL